MALITWSDDLKVGKDFMDADHEDFVTLLNAAAEADASAFPAAFDAVLHHTEEHFARENALMEEIGFFAIGPHTGEHARVLAEMRRMRDHLATGNDAYARAYLTEFVPQWFEQHRRTMDAATAAYARQTAATA